MSAPARHTPELLDRIRADIAAGRSRREIATAVGVGESAITKWVARHGLGTFRIGRVRPVPADFAEHATRETRDQLRARYGVGHHVLGQWCAAVGRAPMQAGTHAKARPADFADKHGQMTVADLCAHYAAGKATVRRWASELALRKQPFGTGRPKGSKSVTTAKLLPFHKPAPVPLMRDLSVAGQAADYLRRLGPVIRCDAAGKYDPAGSHYRRGSTVLTAGEIIARAERLGWRQAA